jgi:protein-serine/threonine kinase
MAFSLICGREHRLTVDQIKQHPFFYGVDWESIRNIEAPFIPDLRSITDTSYFPTEELENVPDVPAGAETDGANKDLAFLGYA